MYAHIFWLAMIGYLLNSALRTIETPGRAGVRA
jgi:hypothetical protein